MKTAYFTAPQVLATVLRDMDASKTIYIHIAGASGSGKTNLAELIANSTFPPFGKAKIISTDPYMKGKEYVEQLLRLNKNSFGWDAIENFDLPRIAEDIQRLKLGEPIQKPVFESKDGNLQVRYEDFNAISGDIIIVEGVHSHHETLRNFADILVYIDAPFHDRLWRRVMRHLFHPSYGGETLDHVVRSYISSVEPSYIQHASFYKNRADISVSNDSNPLIEFEWVLKNGKELHSFASKKSRLVPHINIGAKKHGEDIFIHRKANDFILEYVLDGVPFIQEKIGGICVNLLSSCYTFEPIVNELP